MDPNFKPKITVFHCINIFYHGVSLPGNGENNYQLQAVRLPCSGMIKDIVLLKAFEAGADAVIVLVCPEEQCRYVQGSIRARKRVEWVQNLLDEIGLDGRRLSIFNIASKDEASVAGILGQTLSDLAEMGPNPAA